MTNVRGHARRTKNGVTRVRSFEQHGRSSYARSGDEAKRERLAHSGPSANVERVLGGDAKRLHDEGYETQLVKTNGDAERALLHSGANLARPPGPGRWHSRATYDGWTLLAKKRSGSGD